MHVAGKHLLDGERATAVRQHAGVGVAFVDENIFDDADEPWMTGKDQPGPGCLQPLGDMPGEAEIIADAGDQRDLAFQIQWNHARLIRKGV